MEFEWFHFFACYEERCYEHSCPSLRVGMFSFILGGYLGVEIAGSYGKRMDNFLRNFQNVSQSVTLFYIPPSHV